MSDAHDRDVLVEGIKQVYLTASIRGIVIVS